VSVSTATVVVCRKPDDAALDDAIAAVRLGPWRSVVDAHDGRLVATWPDAIAAAFPAVGIAVAAAVELQRSSAGSGEAADASPWRIGVHVGDVELAPSTADRPIPRTVLVADRIAETAAPGELLVSDLVRQLLSVEAQQALVPAGRVLAPELAERLDTWSVAWRPPPQQHPITVVVAEDSVIVRAGIVALLKEEGFDVVAEVGDRDALLAAARRHQPALIVTDVRMPPNQSDEGITAAALLRAERPESAVLVLSQHVEPAAAAMLLTNTPTAVGYLLKERVSHLDEFVAACRTVAAGGVVVDALVTERLLGADATVGRLTEREREVLDLMAQGRSNGAIARELHCSAKTLEAHIRSVFTKFGLAEDPDDHRRVAAVIRHLHGAS
jgi:DNA-binding NarL/FixJ family response regulator